MFVTRDVNCDDVVFVMMTMTLGKKNFTVLHLSDNLVFQGKHFYSSEWKGSDLNGKGPRVYPHWGNIMLLTSFVLTNKIV